MCDLCDERSEAAMFAAGTNRRGDFVSARTIVDGIIKGGVGPTLDGKWSNLNHTCGKCGHNTPMPKFWGKFCPQCGTAQMGPKTGMINLSQPYQDPRPYCRKCQSFGAEGDGFCTGCGGKLGLAPPLIFRQSLAQLPTAKSIESQPGAFMLKFNGCFPKCETDEPDDKFCIYCGKIFQP